MEIRIDQRSVPEVSAIEVIALRPGDQCTEVDGHSVSITSKLARIASFQPDHSI